MLLSLPQTRTALRPGYGLALGLLVLVAAGAQSQAQTTVKWSGKPGEILKYVFQQSNDIKYTSQGQNFATKSDLNVELTWTIKAIAKDGSLEVTQIADRVRVRIVNAGRILEFDTKDKDTPSAEVAPVAKIYGAVVNQPYALKLSPQGEVIDVKIPDAVVATVGASPLAVMADGPGFFSAKGVKSMIAQTMPTLPSTPISAGTAWKSEHSFPAGLGVMTLKYDFKTDAITPALVTFQSAINTSIAPPADGQIQVKVNKQSGQTIVKFAPSAGHLTESSLTQNLEMITLNASGAEILQTNVITSSLKLIK